MSKITIEMAEFVTEFEPVKKTKKTGKKRFITKHDFTVERKVKKMTCQEVEY